MGIDSRGIAVSESRSGEVVEEWDRRKDVGEQMYGRRVRGK